MNRESAWQEAYKWLCQQRKNAPADGDVWHLRFHWERDGEAFRQRVEEGKHRLKPMRIVNRQWYEPIAMWDADDALVLKWVALQIQDVIPLYPKCHHVKGAGVHRSRREVKNALDSGEYKFVYRTDIHGYYQHMQKSQLNALVQKWVEDPILLDLVEQYIVYSVEDGGEFNTPVNGISRGCALSSLLGASLLFHVDEMFAGKTDLFYARYMDDFLVLSKKRWPLRRAILLLNDQMNAGGFTLHPDKTQIGRVKIGFDWLGLWFDEAGFRRSPRSLQMRANKILRLYERIPNKLKKNLLSHNPLYIRICALFALTWCPVAFCGCLTPPTSTSSIDYGVIQLIGPDDQNYKQSISVPVDLKVGDGSDCSVSANFEVTEGTEYSSFDLYGIDFPFTSPGTNLLRLGDARGVPNGVRGVTSTGGTAGDSIRGSSSSGRINVDTITAVYTTLDLVPRFLQSNGGVVSGVIRLSDTVSGHEFWVAPVRAEYRVVPCVLSQTNRTVDLGDMTSTEQGRLTDVGLSLRCIARSSSVSSVDVTLSGTTNNGLLTGLVNGVPDTSVGVQFYSNGAPTPVGSPLILSLPATSGGTIAPDLTARLVSSSGTSATPGAFSATADVTLTYR